MKKEGFEPLSTMNIDPFGHPVGYTEPKKKPNIAKIIRETGVGFYDSVREDKRTCSALREGIP